MSGFHALFREKKSTWLHRNNYMELAKNRIHMNSYICYCFQGHLFDCAPLVSGKMQRKAKSVWNLV